MEFGSRFATLKMLVADGGGPVFREAVASYRFAENWTTAIRYEHLQGREAGAELHLGDIEYAFDSKKRDRISLALTRSFDLGENDSFLRIQYSHDELPGESADSIFLQFGLNFGPGEVR